MTVEYRIGAIKDFLAVPPESIDACLSDFREWLEVARDHREIDSALNDFLEISGAVSFSVDSFTWRDDGLSGLSCVDIVDKAGEKIIGTIRLTETP